ncbi:c-type cytochrome [Duganella aceris]|uniref:C-type cytochrome n=1 Tax=Duganella aceris TaxID=2703883 RepID=A0ABX0FEV3_9BURK|nr:c-type cytochrome [Duganella aceris]NGZ83067.1 c-type cytochrome [Duganella aceris]
MLKTILIAAALSAGATGAMAAAGAEGGAMIPQGARLAATCAACHGTNGASIGTALPPLAGQPKQALAAALHDFKSGKRQATIMTQIAKGYTDQQIEQLATWFAAQKP